MPAFNLEDLIEKDKSMQEKLEQLQRSAREAKNRISTRTGKYLMRCFEEMGIEFTSNDDIYAIVGSTVLMKEAKSRDKAVLIGKDICLQVDEKFKRKRKKPQESVNNDND